MLLAQEADWLWVLKPAGIPVFPPHGDLQGDCLLRRMGELAGPGFPAGFAGGIAHRLDVSTSGVMLVARSPAALERAREAFGSGVLRKTYRFVSSGQVPWTEHHVTTPIAHHKRRKRKMVVKTGQSTAHRGKWYPADTRFRHLGGRRWEAVIVTGVMHQIRVHAASVGIALDGDGLYGGALLEGAPEGVDFALHHCRMAGIGGCPFVGPPDWWP